jgi:chromosome partitioning protein
MKVLKLFSRKKMESPLRGKDLIKVVDLRNVLGLSPSGMSKIMKSKGFQGRKIEGAQARDILESRGFKYPISTKVISFMICKGGTAKTTSTRFVAQRLAAYGNKVLVIDTDPQGNLTKSFKLEEYGLKLTPNDPVLVDILDKNTNVDIQDTIIPLTTNIDLLPSTPINSRCDNVIRDTYKNPASPLRRILKSVTGYDYILIDCGPSLSITNTAVIGASDVLIMPIDPDEFSLIGVGQTLDEVEDIKNECHIEQEISIKLFLTKYDDREYLSNEMLIKIREMFPNQIFNTHVRKSADLKNCIYEDVDLFDINRSRAKDDYDELTREIMEIQ